MALASLGPDPFQRDELGHFVGRVATVFCDHNAIVSLPGIHATQRLAQLECIQKQRGQAGLPELSAQELDEINNNAVDLIIQPDAIYIRPDPQKMDQALRADAMLQQSVPKRLVRYLLAGQAEVHETIKRRGECWRITPRPISRRKTREMIQNSLMHIQQGKIYYHSPSSGTRLLTCQRFRELVELDDKELQNQLIEIQYFSGKFNRFHQPEVDFFIAHRQFFEPLQQMDFSTLSSTDLRGRHQELADLFESLVPDDLQNDDVDCAEWRQRMLNELQPLADDFVLEEQKLGLAPEFYRHILWLPGGRFEDNEFIFDDVFLTEEEDLQDLRDDTARSLILNYVRDYPDLEYINVGRVNESLALDRPLRGRRDVYVVQMKRGSKPNVIVKIVRFQKWDVRSHLDDGKPLLEAMMKSEEYSEYILDRRLGCRRLGMNLPEHLFQGRVGEVYERGYCEFDKCPIWRPYFERDYFKGEATDKIPAKRFQDAGFARRFAELMGRAAASDMIVGRWDETRNLAYFDDGDEVLIEGEDGLPCDLMVTHHTGAFALYRSSLAHYAPYYAAPINKRIDAVPNPVEFAETYLAEFIAAFRRIQEDYRLHRNAFDSLFGIRPSNRRGSFRYRWERVLERLDLTNIDELADQLKANFRRPGQSDATAEAACLADGC